MSNIEWTDATWNPVRGCTRVSEGCRNCYAERQAVRHSGEGRPYEGLAESTKAGPRWTGEVRFVPKKLAEPLRWREPRRVFVNSMSDLFHEGLGDQEVLRVFATMARANDHVFQILTKRPARALALLSRPYLPGDIWDAAITAGDCAGAEEVEWPLPHVWLGVSVEDQATADERIPLLLRTPAAVRFVSYEPALESVNLIPYMGGRTYRCRCGFHETENELGYSGGDRYYCAKCSDLCEVLPAVEWLIAGGESGPGARPANLSWFRSVREQCEATGVPFFMKQMGADLRTFAPLDGWPPHVRRTASFNRDDGTHSLHLLDRKGGDPDEWPSDLCVRMFPGDTWEGRRP